MVLYTYEISRLNYDGPIRFRLECHPGWLKIRMQSCPTYAVEAWVLRRSWMYPVLNQEVELYVSCVWLRTCEELVVQLRLNWSCVYGELHMCKDWMQPSKHVIVWRERTEALDEMQCLVWGFKVRPASTSSSSDICFNFILKQCQPFDRKCKLNLVALTQELLLSQCFSLSDLIPM